MKWTASMGYRRFPDLPLDPPEGGHEEQEEDQSDDEDEDVAHARHVTPEGTPTASVWQQAAAWEALWETLPEEVGLAGLSGKDAVIAYVSSLRARIEGLEGRVGKDGAP